MEEGGADNVMLCDQQANPVYRRDVETLVGAPVDRTGQYTTINAPRR